MLTFTAQMLSCNCLVLMSVCSIMIYCTCKVLVSAPLPPEGKSRNFPPPPLLCKGSQWFYLVRQIIKLPHQPPLFWSSVFQSLPSLKKTLLEQCLWLPDFSHFFAAKSHSLGWPLCFLITEQHTIDCLPCFPLILLRLGCNRMGVIRGPARLRSCSASSAKKTHCEC